MIPSASAAKPKKTILSRPRYHPQTPVEETLCAFDDLMRRRNVLCADIRAASGRMNRFIGRFMNNETSEKMWKIAALTDELGDPTARAAP